MPKYIITYMRTVVTEHECGTIEEAAKHADIVSGQFPEGEMRKFSIYIDGYAPPEEPEAPKLTHMEKLAAGMRTRIGSLLPDPEAA